jgi:hypothetical protein
MNVDIYSYTENLVEENGIFFSKNKSEVSYPEDGNESYFKLEDNSFWFKHRNNCIISLAKKIAHDKIFFDIGGANGFIAKGLEENGIKTVLIEPGTTGCINAKMRGLTNIICSTLEDVGFKINSLPAAGLFDVLEHIQDDLFFLKTINAYMQAEGSLFITVPAYRFLWSKEDVEAGHYRRYTLSKLKRTLENAGFKIEYSTYIFSFLILPIFLFRSIPGFLGLAKHEKEQSEKEHNINDKGLIAKIVAKFSQFELKQIAKNRKIPFGGSCLIVAKKLKL